MPEFYGASHLEQTDILPAIRRRHQPASNVSLRLELRGNGRRPSFRKLGPISNYDPELGFVHPGAIPV